VATQYNTPVLKDGFLYGLSDRGNFFCINAKTGQTAWSDTATRYSAFGSILDAGPVLMALTEKSQLVVMQPNDKALTQVASIKVADKDTYAHPILSGNRLFVRDRDSVTLWVIE
jgi:outer membrane protein assembly factor BamB